VSRANPQNPVCLKCTGFIYLGQPTPLEVDRVFQTCYNTHIDSKEHMMFVVKRCVRDYEEVWKTEVGQFNTEAEAVEFADAEDSVAPGFDVWHEVDEE
jgi:hypothetical protein